MTDTLPTSDVLPGTQRLRGVLPWMGWMLCAAFFLLLHVPVAQAQQSSARIQQVRVEGVQRIDPTTVMSYIDVQAGDPFDADRLDRALKSL